MPIRFDGPGKTRWITVADENGIRYLHLDHNEEGAMALASEAPVFHYLWFHKCSFLAEGPVRRVLVLGAGAFTAPKCLALDHPQADIDAVDVEPDLGPLGRKYFRVDRPEFQRVHFHGLAADEFLEGRNYSYDFIFDDMFDGFQHVPVKGRGFEHAARLRSCLAADGVCIKNVIWDPRSPETRAACEETSDAFRAAFVAHAVWFLGNPERGHNRLLLGSPSPLRFEVPAAEARLALAGMPETILGKIAARQFDAGDSHSQPPCL